MRWYVILLAIFAAVMIACNSNGGGDDESKIRKTVHGFVQAVNDSDFDKAYGYYSEDCKSKMSLSDFTTGLAQLPPGELEVGDVRIVELTGDRALVDAEITLIGTSEEYPVSEDKLLELVKEGKRWSWKDCEDESTEPASFAPPDSGVPDQSDRRYLALE